MLRQRSAPRPGKQRLELASSAERVVYTVAGWAVIVGYADKLRDVGHGLVSVSEPDGCVCCGPFEDEVLSLWERPSRHHGLSGALEAGPFHAHCAALHSRVRGGLLRGPDARER